MTIAPRHDGDGRRKEPLQVVTKSISGHQTDRMREHYSTVTPDEQATEHQQRREPLRSPTKWGGHPNEWGGSAKSRRRLSAEGLVFPLILCRRDRFRTY